MADSVGTIRLTIRPLLVFQFLVAVAATILAASLAGRLLYVSGYLQSFDFTINELLNVDAEANPPTWFAAMQLFAAGLLALSLAELRNDTQRWGWYLVAGTLTLMSLDEVSSLHEELGRPLRDALGTSGIFYFAWVLVAIPFVITMAVVLRRLLSSLAKQERRLFFAASGLYFCGAIGGEMVSGIVADDQESVGYVFITHVEEGLEYLGVAMLIYALGTIIVGSKHQARMDPVRQIV